MINVITPFTRFENLDAISGMLKDRDVDRWHWVNYPEEVLDLSQNLGAQKLEKEGWLEIHSVNAPHGMNAGLALFNAVAREWSFNEGDWYHFLPDDDFLEPGFYNAIRTSEADLVVCSMLRGDQQPEKGIHPCWELIAGPEHLHYGHCGLEQGIFRGSALNAVQKLGIKPNTPNENFLFLAAQTVKTEYLPTLHVWFNYLEPGRWNR